MSDDEDDYQFLRIIDALHSINQKVNLIGVVSEVGISKQSKGTDCCCTLKIVDESHPSVGISVNLFAENIEKLPCVESAGDIIQLSRVVIKSHRSGVNAVFDKKLSSFALYEGKCDSKFAPYQVSPKFHLRVQDKKFIERLRKWTVSHQPETSSSDSLSLKEIKQGHQFSLTCKVLHICEVTQGEWMLFVWDGTDAPPLNIHKKLEEEFDKPLDLQLEASPLSRDIICTFPRVGTILRMTAAPCIEKLGLYLLKAGKWVQFRNINFEVRSGIWCGILLPKSRFSYLPDDDNLVLLSQRTYKERVKHKWGRMPLSSFPWPSYVTDTNNDHEDVSFLTLMDILSSREATGKFRCVVRVVATLPDRPEYFRSSSCGTYRIRLTLEDPTARIHAYLYAEDAEMFFGGYPSVEKLIKMHNTLLGVDEADDKKPRNPPWVQCCIKSFCTDDNDIWGSRSYGIFDTTLTVRENESNLHDSSGALLLLQMQCGLVPHLNDNSKPYLDQENLDDIIVYSHSLEVWNPEYSVARVAGKEAVRERVCFGLGSAEEGESRQQWGRATGRLQGERRDAISLEREASRACCRGDPVTFMNVEEWGIFLVTVPMFRRTNAAGGVQNRPAEDGRVHVVEPRAQEALKKGGGDGRLYSESMPELDSAKMIIDAGSSDNIASTEMQTRLLPSELAKEKGVGIAFLDVEEESIECYALIAKPTSRAEDRWDAVGVSLPCKAASRLSPFGNEEIRRQVQELLSKGRESLLIISLRRHYLQTCLTSSTYRSSHFLPLALQGPTGLSALDSHLPPPILSFHSLPLVFESSSSSRLLSTASP
nr:nucleic acid-binding, OB-fold-like protein [Tanacetum cinerariifolium]